MSNSTEYCSFSELMDFVKPELRSICLDLRKLIASLHKNYVEIVWKNQKIASYGVGPKKMSEHYVYIAPQGKHVNLGFYHGAVISDPQGLLEGTGKLLRHIKIRHLKEVKNKSIKQLIKQSIADREAIFSVS